LSGGVVEDDNLSDEDDENDSAEQKNRKLAHRFFKASAAFSDFVAGDLPSDIQSALNTSIADVSSKQFLTNTEKLEKLLTKTFQHKSRSVALPSTRVDRPSLAAKDALAFCVAQGKRVDTKWGPKDIDQMRKEAIDTLANVEGMTLNIADLQDSARMVEAPVQGVDAEDGEDPQTKLLWDLRESMGT
jgi:hypothetical protein